MTNLFHDGYALIIGIGADIPATVQDAIALKELLIDPGRAAYPHEQVELLTENNANKDNILLAFDRLIQRTSANPNATTVVYFSGHGGRLEIPGKPHQYFLVPYGYDPDYPMETAILSSEFTTKIESIKAKKLIVLLDCCHAGGIPALKDINVKFVKSPVPPDLLDILSTGTGKIVVASSYENEVSYAGTPYSLFTACLLEALSGKAAVHDDGYARILDVLIYLYKYVPERSNERQHPFVKKVLDLGDNFPLCYYAGGHKTAQVGGSTHSLLMGKTNLTTGQRNRLRKRLEMLEQPRELLSQKVVRMRTALVIEASEAIKFQLEQQLLIAEAELANIDSEIDKLEQEI